jgi:hypothetical protein
MRTRFIAVLELLLLFPALLFMGALVVRELQPLQYEPAHSAHQLVMWYAARMWTLWILLLALPLTALVTGSATLLRNWKGEMAMPHGLRQSLAVMRTHPATLLVAAATLAAAGILVIVVLHMAAN